MLFILLEKCGREEGLDVTQLILFGKSYVEQQSQFNRLITAFSVTDQFGGVKW